MGRQVLRPLFGVVYVLLAVLVVVGLLGSRPPVTDPVQVLVAALVLGVALGGLALLLLVPWVDGHLPDPVLCTAPSGVPATCFPRSPALAVLRGVACLGLAVWSAVFAVVAHGYGRDGWALLLAGGALAVLWWPVALVTGRARPGGLWLTRSGLEYRQDATGWTVPWAQLRTVVAGTDQEARSWPGPVLLHPQPLLLVLQTGAQVEVRQRSRWIRDDLRRRPDGTLGVDCFGLAGGRPLIVGTIEHYLLFPELCGHLGTAASLPHGPG